MNICVRYLPHFFSPISVFLVKWHVSNACPQVKYPLSLISTGYHDGPRAVSVSTWNLCWNIFIILWRNVLPRGYFYSQLFTLCLGKNTLSSLSSSHTHCSSGLCVSVPQLWHNMRKHLTFDSLTGKCTNLWSSSPSRNLHLVNTHTSNCIIRAHHPWEQYLILKALFDSELFVCLFVLPQGRTIGGRVTIANLTQSAP